MKYEDPTAKRIARDDELRQAEKVKRREKAKYDIGAIFRDASSKGQKGPMKTNAAGHKAAAENPRRVK
ncbi:hypothetical protein [Peteryoungia algae]|uniref:Uncharacterized protein n=1 Tax=Peteryoungia algae TaxID=2919917 RepID=A0ABT0D2J4_9HYPH|nr:hypothetical protein [Rhizobium sp. SSM4.3]MCJ8239633.1 hypothetical protein [Rhizobium sp. SSM4.3]